MLQSHGLANEEIGVGLIVTVRLNFNNEVRSAVGVRPFIYSVLDRTVTTIYPTDLEGLTTVGTQAFSSCQQLTTVVLNGGIEQVLSNAFEACTALTSFSADYVTYLGPHALDGCMSLNYVSLSNVLYIELSAFGGNECLADLYLPNVSTINDSAFSGCYNLYTITIGKPENSISGAPWGAENATIYWTG